MAQTNYYSSNKSNNRKKNHGDPIEYKIVLGILRGIIWLVTFPFRGKASPPKSRKNATIDTQEVAHRWNDIQTTVGLGGVTHFGAAVVAADKLLDYVLRQKGYRGETMGERLVSAKNDVSPSVYHNAWQAHKLRNQLVHEVDGQVLSFQIKEAMNNYEAILRELGALR